MIHYIEIKEESIIYYILLLYHNTEYSVLLCIEKNLKNNIINIIINQSWKQCMHNIYSIKYNNQNQSNQSNEIMMMIDEKIFSTLIIYTSSYNKYIHKHTTVITKISSSSCSSSYYYIFIIIMMMKK